MTKAIAMLPDPVLAGFVTTVLEEHGVRALEVQTASHASLAGGDTGYFVEVADEDVARAARVLAERELGRWLLVAP